MAKFIEGHGLNAELEKIFKNAKSHVLLISPLIKLHDRYRSALILKEDDPAFEIVVVFGKNEDDYSRSMGMEDLNFFKTFPNIEIRYERRLHAKYYANESSAIITSMNLYSYSQDNNIEAGVLTESKMFSSDSVDGEAYEYFNRVIKQSQLLFKKVPQFESKLMGFSKSYTHSTVEVDTLSEVFPSIINNNLTSHNRNNYQKKEAELAKRTSANLGYCIRTAKQIPFNPKCPMCDEAYNNWKNYSNLDYKENYCHFSGEQSNGETSYSRPILKKNWYQAKKMHSL